MSAPVAEGMSHGGEDDVALVMRTLAGDRAAFGTLVQRYEEPVRRVARAVLHDVSDADDAAQDTFLTALMKLDRYDQRRPFRPWLLRSATNTAIDRRRHRRLTISLLTVNLLGGLDEWLHGTANLHGWGFAAAPDPVLLYVRSFDPVARRFSYGVNGRVGATAGANGEIGRAHVWTPVTSLSRIPASGWK